MAKSYENRFESFNKSLNTLKTGISADKNNQLILSGIIMSFNLTFDISWKLIREIMKDEFGVIEFPSGSPKETLKKAKGLNIIDEKTWLSMLDDRNELVHDYDFNNALEKSNKILNEYVPVFENFKSKVEEIINK